MRAIRSNMKDQDKRILHCPECNSEFSGNAGDYWDVPSTHIFKCADCGCEMELVDKVVTIEYK